MQIVANCILRQDSHILLLQKPRRGWWVAPGGKVELGESLVEAITREYQEETGLTLKNPILRGVFTMVLQEDQQINDHWMLFTFYSDSYTGNLLPYTDEGTLDWIEINSMSSQPMAAGDQIFVQHILNDTSLITGKFTYTPDYQLLDWKPEMVAPIGTTF